MFVPEEDILISLQQQQVLEGREPFGTPRFYTCVMIAAGLTCFAGMMSGLTVGLLSIDQLDLELKENIGTVEEQK